MAPRGCLRCRPGCRSFRPVPNLKTLESLFHYPGLCLFEGTNLSVGRGSDAPFDQIGAPWLDTTRVLADMRAARAAGRSLQWSRLHPDESGRREVCRHHPHGNSVDGHRPGQLRPDGDGGISAGRRSRGVRRSIRVASGTFRPIGRRSGPPGGTRCRERAERDRRRLERRSGAVQAAKEGVLVVPR